MNKTKILKNLISASLLASLPIMIPAKTDAKTFDRPNIIMILSDDHGSADFGFRGVNVDTPHMDRLFFEGRSLNRFYVQPQCTPSRAALMTGRYPARFGMHYGVVLPHSQWGLPEDEITLAEALREEGYETAMIGKWHLGHAAEAMLPENRGFNYFFGNYNGSLDYFKHEFPGGRGHDLHLNREPVFREGYVTHLYGEDAARVIREHDHDGKPLFLYLALTAPHDPWQAPEETIQKYRERGFEGDRAIYLAMVEEMDNAIGKVIDAVHEAGIDHNTLIIYASDNGGPFAPEITSNGFLRGEKGTTFEGGIHVPAVAWWKGQIPAGTSTDELLYIGDLYPTFLRLAGGVPNQAKPLDSYDVTRTLVSGHPSPRQHVVQVTGPETFWNGVITDRWKLLISVHDGRIPPDEGHFAAPANHKLFDFRDDRYEQTNVIADYPEVYEYLLKLWRSVYDERVESQFSFSQATGDDPEIWGQFE